MSQEMSSDIGFGAANTGGEDKPLKNPKGSNLGAAKSAANDFISKARAVAGNLQGENDALKNQITVLKGELTKCGMELHECQSRDCEEYDSGSVENMVDPRQTR